MNPTRRATLGAALGAALATPLAGRGARAARAPGLLVFGLSSYPPNLLPWNNSGTAAQTVKMQIHRGLLSLDAAGALRSELAQSWERSGELGWLFRLRPAVFHNGAPVTAADVKWSIEQAAGEKSTAYLKAEMQGIARIDTPDAATVLIVMKEPSAVLPAQLASPHMPVLARGEAGAPAVGCGPYVMKAQERGVSVDLEAFPKFYKPGLPKTKTLRFVAYADENLRVAALQAGDVDVIEYVPWQSMTAIEADRRLKLANTDGPFMGLNFNGAQGPFTNKLVRQAVAFAVKREEIVNAAFFGRGTPLTGMPIAPSSPFYDEKRAHHWSYDPDRARALLAKAGVANGFSCTLLSTAQYGMHKSTAEIVQQNLAAIGVQVTLNLPDWATRVTLGGRGQYEFCVQGTSTDNSDPDALATLLDGELPANISRSFGLRTPELHALFAAGRAAFDEGRRRAIYAEMEMRALDECPLVGLAWRAQGYAMARDLLGFRNLPGSATFFSGLTLEDSYFA